MGQSYFFRRTYFRGQNVVGLEIYNIEQTYKSVEVLILLSEEDNTTVMAHSF